MKNRILKKSHWLVGIFISALLPIFGILSKTEDQTELTLDSSLQVWVFSFAFLLISWFLNSKLTRVLFSPSNKWNIVVRILIIIVLNSLLVIVIAFIVRSENYLTSTSTNADFLITFIRASVGVGLIFLVQFTLNLNARNQKVALQNQMLRTENLQAQFELLRRQISPHFLFNSLSTLHALIRSSNKDAEQFVLKLADIYRVLLIQKEKETITVNEELELLNDYTFLLFIRYEQNISIDIDIPDALRQNSIPTFAIQLLLENCVKHNIVSKDKPLHIKIFDSGNHSLTIENNLQPKNSPENSTGHGLSNLKKRYEFLGINEGVKVFSDESVFRVRIKILGE